MPQKDHPSIPSFSSSSGDFRDVAAENDLAEGAMLGVDIDGERVLLARVKGEVCAIGGICTHQIARLEDGYIEGAMVRCPRHGAGFDLHTGEALHAPADMPVPVYDVRCAQGRLLVSLKRPPCQGS